MSRHTAGKRFFRLSPGKLQSKQINNNNNKSSNNPQGNKCQIQSCYNILHNISSLQHICEAHKEIVKCDPY